jgi:hypothetical protein
MRSLLLPYLCLTSLFAADGADVPDDIVGGKRDESVTVQVELHGERYETLQDAMNQGALTRPVRPDRF